MSDTTSSPAYAIGHVTPLWQRISLFPFYLVRYLFGLLFNPILGKELRVSSRRRRTYYLRSAHLLLLLIIMFIVWLGIMQSSSIFSGAEESIAARLQSESSAGQSLSIGLGWLQMIALMLIAPMLTASCISDEVEDRTLDVLVASPLSSSQIVFGKFMSRLAHLLMLMLLSMPFLLAMRAYGGFSVSQLLRIEVLCITTAILASSVGLLLSCWEKQSWRATAASYFWLALWWLVVPYVAVSIGLWALHYFTGPIDALAAMGYIPDRVAFLIHHAPNAEFQTIWLITLCFTSPAFTLACLNLDDFIPMFLPISATVFWMVCNVINLSAAIIVLALATRLVRRKSMVRHSVPIWKRMFRFLLLRNRSTQESHTETNEVRLDPCWMDSLRVPRVWNRPVLWRECRSPLFKSRLQKIIAFIAISCVLAWSYYKGDPFDEPMLHIAFMFGCLVFQIFVSAVASTSVITMEKQADSWAILLCTPVAAHTILFDKLFGVIKRTCLPFVFITVHSLYFAVNAPKVYPMETAIQVILIVFTAMIFVSTTGIIFSLLLKRSLSAVTMNLALILGIWAALPAFMGIIMGVLNIIPDNEKYFAPILIINPFYWCGVIAEYMDSSSYYSQRSMEGIFWEPQLITASLTLFGILIVVILLVSFAMLFVSKQFNRICGRAS